VPWFSDLPSSDSDSEVIVELEEVEAVRQLRIEQSLSESISISKANCERPQSSRCSLLA
jgi:hypothetical protein